MNLKEKYKNAKAAKVGDEIQCPSCGTVFITPANARYYETVIEPLDFDDDQGWDAHKDSVK